MCSKSFVSFVVTHKTLQLPVRSVVPLTAAKLNSFAPFRNWLAQMEARLVSSSKKSSGFRLNGIEIQSVDMFGAERVGFVKFRADMVHPNGRAIAGVTVLRGASVAMLTILRNAGDGQDYVALVRQPRVPVAETEYLEIPAGMIDETVGADKTTIFVGAAARELEEEVGVKITERDSLVDLTAKVANAPNGLHLSPGLIDEAIKIYLYKADIESSVFERLQGEVRSRVDEDHEGENEVITVKLVLLKDVYKVGLVDAKSILAISLYEQYLKSNAP